MKRILVTGAGGSPATNFVRSLRAAPEKMFLFGTDCHKYYLMRAETDEKCLIPKASEDDYIDVLNYLIKKNKLEFAHIQNDIEMGIISENREKLKIMTFLPKKETVRICLNKFDSYKIWKAAGIKQPHTMLLRNEGDLKKSFETLGNKIWIRDTTGAGGRGSIAVDNFKTAKTWMDFKEGWGKYVAAEYLSPQSITWQSIWKDGELIVAQARLRLYWELAQLAPSGISGATGGGLTVSDRTVDEIAEKAILAIDKKPHGIFSVDLTYDKNNIPNPTEINIGRFFTTHEFFTKAGLNMPYMLVKLAYNEDIGKIIKKINPLKEGLLWIRGMDFLPVLTEVKNINYYEEELNKLRNIIKHEKKF